MPNPYETLEKYSPYEVIIFSKFHKNWAKIVDFLVGQSDFRIAFLMKLQIYLYHKNNKSCRGTRIHNTGIHIVMIEYVSKHSMVTCIQGRLRHGALPIFESHRQKGNFSLKRGKLQLKFQQVLIMVNHQFKSSPPSLICK